VSIDDLVNEIKARIEKNNRAAAIELDMYGVSEHYYNIIGANGAFKLILSWLEPDSGAK
jgi:hypothetical protein